VTGGQDVQPTYAEDKAQGELEHWRQFAKQQSRSGGRRHGSRLDPRVKIAGAAGAALFLLVLAIWRPWSGGSGLSAGDEALGGPRAEVLVQLRDDAGRAVGSAVIQHDRTEDRGAVVGMPDDLAVDVPDLNVDSALSGDAITLGGALRAAGESLTRDAVADVLGVDVAGSFVLDVPTFANVVTRLGGIEVKIDSPVTVNGRVVAQPGSKPVELNGDAAVAYAALPQGASTTRAQRFVQILEGIIAKVPQDYDLTADFVDAVGLIGNGTLTPERLAAILSGAARDQADGALKSAVLPVQADGLLDVTRAAPLVRGLLGGKLTGRTDVTPRVLVQMAVSGEGSARDSLRERARADVLNAGYRFVEGGFLPPQSRSLITVYGGNGIGDGLALALGLDRSVVHAGKGDGVADAVVVLGSDYRP
jgi:LytR_cpsA_psr family